MVCSPPVPPCHYPGGDGGEQREGDEGRGRRRGRKEGGKQKTKRGRSSRDLCVTKSQVRKPERDTEGQRGRADVTETERQVETGMRREGDGSERNGEGMER